MYDKRVIILAYKIQNQTSYKITPIKYKATKTMTRKVQDVYNAISYIRKKKRLARR